MPARSLLWTDGLTGRGLAETKACEEAERNRSSTALVVCGEVPDKEKGDGSLRPLGLFPWSDRVYIDALGALGALPNSENCSLPTKPNAVTPDPLMMFSTWAAVS